MLLTNFVNLFLGRSIKMDFQGLVISYQYRSDVEEINVVRDFYIPVLSSSKTYKRAVGYFTSSSLTLAAKGFAELIENGGKIQLIASPYLEKVDIEAIEQGYKQRDEMIEEALNRQLEHPENEIQRERLNYLAWLIANNQLDIKIAVLKNLKQGIYHEKLGLMEDYCGNKVAFTGSSNETIGGLVNNFESIDVFCSWNPSESMRVERKERDFNALWDNSTKNLEVIEFPQALKDKLLSFKRDTYSKADPEATENLDNALVVKEKNQLEFFPKIPSHIKVRKYQKEAIISWFKNECQGLLEMATGTGKTITALSALSKLYEHTGRLGVVIVCPYTHLVDQWVKDIKAFNMSPIVAYHSKTLWEEDLNYHITAFQSGIINHFCLITTNKTYLTDTMQALLRRLSKDILFIADEAHHLGAEHSRVKLIDEFPYRLALSATPNRWYDDEATEQLINYFGSKVVFKFGLDKAIGEFLTQYYYYPHLVYLDQDEAELYHEITNKIAKYSVMNDDGPFASKELMKNLLIERARILSRARNKIHKLKELMVNRTMSNYNLFYCGDSSIDGERQIDRVVKTLGNELDMSVHTFTSREDKQERQELLKRFEDGNLQGLVAIKCLDEGVDVPATQTAYILASSTNPREFIQRRGRVLRKHPLKSFSYINDFIVVPRPLSDVKTLDAKTFNIERNMLKRELDRFTEFADLALNGPEAHEVLNEIKKNYNLLSY